VGSRAKRRTRQQAKKGRKYTSESLLSSIEKELGLQGLFDGEVFHLSFDCPKPLAKAFKQATHDNGTSICKELQKYALTYVTKDHIEKSAFGNTLSKVLNPHIAIENLNFEQYCQTKPRRWNKKSTEQVKGVNNFGEEFHFCEIGDCRQPAVSIMIYSQNKREYRVCLLHHKEYSRKNRDWIFKKHIEQSKEGT
jgi:hypothetical protein